MAAVIFTSWWLWKETGAIERTREHRASVKASILQAIRENNQGAVLGVNLDSYCGKAVYTVRVKSDAEPRRSYWFDIDTGMPLSKKWLEACLHVE
jgi:uncharacterized membrane protein YkoI